MQAFSNGQHLSCLPKKNVTRCISICNLHWSPPFLNHAASLFQGSTHWTSEWGLRFPLVKISKTTYGKKYTQNEDEHQWERHLAKKINKKTKCNLCMLRTVISKYFRLASLWVSSKLEAVVKFPLRSWRVNFPVDVTCDDLAAQPPLVLIEHNRMLKINRVPLASINASTLSK